MPINHRQVKPPREPLVINAQFELNLDMDELRQQKAWLCKLAFTSVDGVAEADGLINMIDFIQDYVVSHGYATARHVFNAE